MKISTMCRSDLQTTTAHYLLMKSKDLQTGWRTSSPIKGPEVSRALEESHKLLIDPARVVAAVPCRCKTALLWRRISLSHLACSSALQLQNRTSQDVKMELPGCFE